MVKNVHVCQGVKTELHLANRHRKLMPLARHASGGVLRVGGEETIKFAVPASSPFQDFVRKLHAKRGFLQRAAEVRLGWVRV